MCNRGTDWNIMHTMGMDSVIGQIKVCANGITLPLVTPGLMSH